MSENMRANLGRDGDRLDDVRLDDVQLDRLVDGELSASEYQELVSSLDDLPDGWRRCAAAFLEAQAWGQEFSSVRTDAQVSAAVSASTDGGNKKDGDGGQRVLTWLAVAASFLLTLTVGLALRGWPGGSQDGPGDVAVDQETILSSDAEELRSPLDRGLAREDGEARPESSPQPREVAPLGRVRLVMDGGDGTPSEFEVPYYDVDQLDPSVWSQRQVPAEVEEALERLGHQLRRTQRVVGTTGNGGRPVVVPVEQFEIVPIRGTRFQ